MIIAYEPVCPEPLHRERRGARPDGARFLPRVPRRGQGVRRARRPALAAPGWLLPVVVPALLVVPSPAFASPRADERSHLELSGMTFVDSRGERREVVLEARQVTLPPGTDVARMQDVHVRMAPEATGQGQAFEMTCERGDLSLSSSDFRAEGDVRGFTGDGRTFRTTWVRYDSKTGLISTEAPVQIDDGSHVLRGNGFRYHLRDGRFVLTGGATVVRESRAGEAGASGDPGTVAPE